MVPPERLDIVPLLALVQDVRAENEIEAFIQAIRLPVEPSSTDASGPRCAVQAREQKRGRFEIREENAMPHRRGDRAREAHPAAEIEDVQLTARRAPRQPGADRK